jgi:mono/diheme cytochrome c family protein
MRRRVLAVATVPTRRRLLAVGATVAAAAGVVACGEQGISSQIAGQPKNVQHGALLFSDRCSGCHNLDVVGAQGGAMKVRDRERVDGPNFNVRKEDVNTVLYAIRNGGYSGAIMPENIVTGQDANDVAAFLAKYAGTPGGRKGNEITPKSQGGNTQAP